MTKLRDKAELIQMLGVKQKEILVLEKSNARLAMWLRVVFVLSVINLVTSLLRFV